MTISSKALVLPFLLAFALPAHAQDQSIDYGDDSGQWTNDGECDDPRFFGQGMAIDLDVADIRADATDCRTLMEAGQLRLTRVEGESSVEECAAIDFGDDTSDWANDNECDDPRFTGSATDGILLREDMGRDASDCSQLCSAGVVWLR